MKPSGDDQADARGSSRGWAVVIGICALLILWGLLNYLLVSDRPRVWDFGAVPATPGASGYSTEKLPHGANASRQIAPLPEADRDGAAGSREKRK